MSSTGIGAPVRRKEDKRFVTGKGRYVDDINRPGQAHAYFVRSPHAHATIKSVDTSAALKMPGVVAIYTGEDVAAADTMLARLAELLRRTLRRPEGTEIVLAEDMTRIEA